MWNVADPKPVIAEAGGDVLTLDLPLAAGIYTTSPPMGRLENMVIGLIHKPPAP